LTDNQIKTKDMKKILTTTILAVALASGSVYAQGKIIFKNASTQAVTFGDASSAAAYSAAMGATLPGGTVDGPFVAGLYYNSSADSATTPSSWTQIGNVAAFSTLTDGKGTFGPQNITTPGTTAAGASAWFMVRVWERAYGATWETASTASLNGRGSCLGESSAFFLKTGTLVGTVTPVQAFTVTLVPEPSTFALGLLGLAGLFLIRRK
jgi:hypothetical protein